MPELLTPGVFVQEVDLGPQPIEGVSTSTAGFVGEADQGPTQGPPVLVTSFPDFQREFGGVASGKDLPLAVRGFFDNGGRRAFISRVVGAGASAASATIAYAPPVVAVQNLSATFNASNNATAITLTLSSVVGIANNSTVTVSKQSGMSTPLALSVGRVNATNGRVDIDLSVGTPPTRDTLNQLKGGSLVATIGVTDAADGVIVRARDVGLAGNGLSVLITAETPTSALIQTASVSTDTILVLDAVPDGLAVGDRVALQSFAVAPAENTAVLGEVTAIDLPTRTVTLDGDLLAGLTGAAVGGRLFLVRWSLTVFDGAAVLETLTNLTSDPDAIAAQVAALSDFVRIEASSGPTDPLLDVTANQYPSFARLEPRLLQGGGDTDAMGMGGVTFAEIIGEDSTFRSGLKALEAQQGINIIAAPGWSSDLNVANELISQAERLQDRFAVIDTPRALAVVDKADVAEIRAFRANFNTRYAAVYYPWVTVTDTRTGNPIAVPPSGHVIGAYARTDNERGVFKAPANVVVRNITGFTVDVPDGQQDILNPDNINVLRRQDGLGNVIWGARVMTAESLWRYVPVRRLFIFLEQSIIRGTRFAVFEPNAPPLWARLRDGISNFLTSQWRAGALVGNTPEESFFVKVDETTTTQDDRDNGRVNIIIGLAPVKPAEFILIQIGQAPNSVILAEQ